MLWIHSLSDAGFGLAQNGTWAASESGKLSGPSLTRRETTRANSA